MNNVKQYIKRLFYLLYYIKKMEWQRLSHFLFYSSRITQKPRSIIFLLSLFDAVHYNIGILDYFSFRFYERTEFEKHNWAGTGYMYEYQLKMNPIKERYILEDKRQFYKCYKKFFNHKVYSIEDLNNISLMTDLLNNPSNKLVFKISNGKCGDHIEIRETKDFNSMSLVKYMKSNKYDMVEEFINQHHILNELSPSGVNTVRIITQLNDNDEVNLLGCRLRISENSPVDNLAAGNLAAPIDEETGIIKGPAVYSEINKSDQKFHPITGVAILGFQIPFWSETLNLAKDAALLNKQNKSIGWDIVVTEKGPGLLEGNHDWCKLLWQLPVKMGLKDLLEKYQKR
jgi:Sugar-transfer associated ATP-grasp